MTKQIVIKEGATSAPGGNITEYSLGFLSNAEDADAAKVLLGIDESNAPVSGPQAAALALKASDGEVVKLAGAQTIDGAKNFSVPPTVPDDSFAIDKISGLPSALGSKADQTALELEVARASLAEAVIGNTQRPGDFAAAYGSQITGTAAATTPYSVADVTIDPDRGAVVQVNAVATHVASRDALALEAGRVYQARYAVRRTVDPSDPLNDAVEIGLRFLNGDGTGVAGGSGNRVVETIALTVADGWEDRTFTFSLDVDGVDYVIPAAARYGRSWVRFYGTDHQTRVSRVRLTDITEVFLAQAGLSAGLDTERTERTDADSARLQKAENLADLENTDQARTNLSIDEVDNTRDVDKPISTAAQGALDTKAGTDIYSLTAEVRGRQRDVTAPAYFPWYIRDNLGRYATALDEKGAFISFAGFRDHTLSGARSAAKHAWGLNDVSGRSAIAVSQTGQFMAYAGTFDGELVTGGRDASREVWAVKDLRGRVALAVDQNGKVNVVLGEASAAAVSALQYQSPDKFVEYQVSQVRQVADGLVALRQEFDGKVFDVRQLTGKGAAVVEHRNPLRAVLWYGQSNATNTGSEPALIADPIYPHHNLAFEGQIEGHRDSLTNTAAFVGLEAQDNKNTGTAQEPSFVAAIAFEEQTRTATGLPSSGLLTYTSHYGGQPIETFERDEIPWTNLMLGASKSVEIAALYDREVECPAVVFIQGESGPFTGYKAALIALAIDVRNEVQAQMGLTAAPEFLVVQTSEYDNVLTADTVFQDQWEASKETGGITMVGPMYQCPLEDDIHLDALGRMVMGEMVAYVQRVIYAGDPWVPLQPASSSISTDTIDIVFDVPAGGIVFDSDWIEAVDDEGFVVTEDGAPVGITSVSIVGDDTVRIVLDATPSGAVQVQYAFLTADTASTGWGNGRGHLYSPTTTPSTFHALGYDVPEFVRHYSVRFILDL